MGLMWGLFSVIIASAAQLSLGFAASHLPPMTHLWDFIAALLAFGLDAGYCYSGCRVICFPFFVGIKHYINLH